MARAALLGDAGATLLVVEPTAWSRAARADANGRTAELTELLAGRGVVINRVALIRKLPVDPRHRARIDYPAVRRQFAARPASHPDLHPETRP